ncbi:hypothetical protein Hamer_G029230 [Homarus americanus]|uniref:Uncharacterized protein n=1 Tax=Homarus americanus TaxID=6706 RepID=A0A8J5K2G6_HOMAM|nr:hypothetical protein Hamer_G029230 [Homarus americanus]
MCWPQSLILTASLYSSRTAVPGPSLFIRAYIITTPLGVWERSRW